jgi:hypothetical protein
MRQAAAGLLALLTLTLAPAARAQTIGGTIGGVVLEDSTRMPVAGAAVTAVRVDTPTSSVGATTDSIGHFEIKLPAEGKFKLHVTHPSYVSLVTDSVDVDKDEVVSLELHLGRDAIPLKPLVVTARVDARVQAFYARARGGNGFGHFVTRADIERRPSARVTDLLRYMPGVRVTPTSVCNGCSTVDVVYMRGATGNCAPTVLIDGMVTKQDATFTLDSFLMPDMLEGIEVYQDPAGVPPALGAVTSSCGAIALWTRTPEGKGRWWVKLLAGGAAILVFAILLEL